MNPVVFLGPSLPREEARLCWSDAVFRDPAECGDVYRAVTDGARAIGLCDGYFDHRLAPWHKEILWAMKQGVAVYGAASMGALRAVELEAFGMIGVGEVFRWYAEGRLEDDDEVAVIHEAPERGFRPRSEAAVNVRATLARAVEAGVIAPASAEHLVGLLKTTFYPERSYGRLLEGAAGQLPAGELRKLQEFLAGGGSIDVKRLDVLALLERMRADAAHGFSEYRPADFRFEQTNAFHELCRSLGGAADPVRPKSQAGDPVARANWVGLPAQAFERALCLMLAEESDRTPDAETLQDFCDEFRRDRALWLPEDFSAWLAEHQLVDSLFVELAYDELLVREHRTLARRLARTQLPALAILGHVGKAPR